MSMCFQPGEGSSRGLLFDCKTSRNLRDSSFEALVGSGRRSVYSGEEDAVMIVSAAHFSCWQFSTRIFCVWLGATLHLPTKWWLYCSVGRKCATSTNHSGHTDKYPLREAKGHRIERNFQHMICYNAFACAWPSLALSLYYLSEILQNTKASNTWHRRNPICG